VAAAIDRPPSRTTWSGSAEPGARIPVLWAKQARSFCGRPSSVGDIRLCRGGLGRGDACRRPSSLVGSAPRPTHRLAPGHCRRAMRQARGSLAPADRSMACSRVRSDGLLDRLDVTACCSGPRSARGSHLEAHGFRGRVPEDEIVLLGVVEVGADHELHAVAVVQAGRIARRDMASIAPTGVSLHTLLPRITSGSRSARGVPAQPAWRP